MSPQPNAVSFEQAQTALAREIKTVLRHRNGHATSTIITPSVALEDMDALAWMHANPGAARVYWSGRDDGLEAAGIGIAHSCCESFAGDLLGLREQLGPPLTTCSAGIRYYGGIRFDLRLPYEPHWETFGAWSFILPRFELRRCNGQAKLRCNLNLPRDYGNQDRIVEDLYGLNAETVPVDLPKPLSHAYRPSRAEWRTVVDSLLRTIGQSPLEKIVLARETRVVCAGGPDPVTLLRLLKSGTPRCFHFLFQPAGQSAFIGASPERLFRRRNRDVETEAVAGSRPRGRSAADDARLVEELLNSDKERREHEFVRVSLKEDMLPLSTDLQMDADCSVMRLASARHLVSRMKARLRRGVTSLDVLEAIHPSPAVGGLPSSLALDALLKIEPFDRGWYAGPVGWIGPNAAEFAVGIRSGLIHGQQVRLYSGAGIVPGSTWQSEWDEIGDKIVDFSRVLGISTQEDAAHQAAAG
ncbi:MAG: isochorismate synthase [Bacteroidota bacterium]|nr:isochorismate synthase [Bacteroidota bacterium]MDE2833102.1 isochorismate synthase [Bacteroidota bacterium]